MRSTLARRWTSFASRNTTVLRIADASDSPETTINAFLAARYTNPATVANYRTRLLLLFASANVSHPGQFTDAALLAWISEPASNNYRRDRLSLVRVFLRWCHKQDPSVPELDDDVARHIRNGNPRIYGRRQAKTPARFLTADEAETLVAACTDGTWIGSRDQLLIRFGLLGIRVDEIRRLTWRALLPDGTLSWIGKKNRPRSASPGPKLTALLARWKRQQERQLGRAVTPTDPIICARAVGGGTMPLRWDTPIACNDTAVRIVNSRAAAAGLGHVAPHDLRRSAGAIMHRARTPDGGHLYDLLDIQQVLDHADPATTQRSYLDQIDNETKANAGRTLDL